MYCFFYKLTLTFFSLFTCWRQDKLCYCLPNHVNMFYYCLHVDVWQLSLWWLRGKAAQPTCVIIFYVYIINVSCYFLHFHVILFCYYLHFDVLLLCKHLTAFLVVVARQGSRDDMCYHCLCVHNQRAFLFFTLSFYLVLLLFTLWRVVIV